MIARLMPRPDIRLDRETWDGRLQVETITRRGIEAFHNHRFHTWLMEWRINKLARLSGAFTKTEHDRCLREFIAAKGLVVEGED